MEITFSFIGHFCSRFCSIRDTKLHAREHDKHHNNHPDDQRNDPGAGVWRKLQKCQRQQCDTQRGHQRFCNNILGDRSNQGLQPRGCYQECRRDRADRHYKNDHNQRYNQLLICLLAIIFCVPVRAEQGGTTAIANPVATSTGSVSNQAVQINQGSYSQQGYGNGHTCNSSTLVLTPFYLGNDVNNPEAAYTRNQNFGAQVSLSMPLDFEMVRLCKELARRKIEKERLDYELVRILKCIEIKKAGYMIHPSSPYASVCADVVEASSVRR